MNKTYTDDELQAYRLRLCTRMDTLLARYPGEDNEYLHTRWCNAFNAFSKRYQGIEDMLIDRDVDLLPIPDPLGLSGVGRV